MKSKIIGLGFLLAVGIGIIFAAGCISSDNPQETPVSSVTEHKTTYDYFMDEVVKISRPSGHLERINSYLHKFAEDHNLDCKEDAAGNILITRGKNPVVTLQGHQDMVLALADGKTFDYRTDDVKPYEKDGWLHADGTSLGADDGIGISVMLSALSSPEFKDTSIACLFTVDEETGCLGASVLSPDFLPGKYLINVDAEDIDTLLVSSAGSANLFAAYSVTSWNPAKNNDWFRVKISGGLGGHSGVNIDKGSANAIQTLVAIVNELPYQEISEFTGVVASNAIPTSASILVSVNPADADTFKARLSSLSDELKKEYANTDPDVIVTFEKTAAPAYAYPHAAAEQIITSVTSCVNGLIEKTEFGILTYSNIGTITSDEHEVTLRILPRASDNSTLKQVEKDIMSHFEKHGFTVKENGFAPAWGLSEEEPEFVQTILNTYQTVFRKRTELQGDSRRTRVWYHRLD